MINMELLPEIIKLIQLNLPAIFTVILGVLATRFLLWRKFKIILADIGFLIGSASDAIDDDQITMDEVNTIIADVQRLLDDLK